MDGQGCGCVYVIKIVGYPLVKVGRTMGDPGERVNELSYTIRSLSGKVSGYKAPSKELAQVVYTCECRSVEELAWVEKMVHKVAAPLRVNGYREWYAVPTARYLKWLTGAIEQTMWACRRKGPYPEVCGLPVVPGHVWRRLGVLFLCNDDALVSSLKPEGALDLREVIKELERRRGDRTLMDLAAEIGVSFQQLAKVMNGGKRRPDAKTLKWLGYRKVERTGYVRAEE